MRSSRCPGLGPAVQADSVFSRRGAGQGPRVICCSEGMGSVSGVLITHGAFGEAVEPTC